MAVHANAQQQTNVPSNNGLTSIPQSTAMHSASTANYIPAAGSTTEPKQIQVPIQFIQSAQSGKLKPVPPPLVRLIKTPKKVCHLCSNILIFAFCAFCLYRLCDTNMDAGKELLNY